MIDLATFRRALKMANRHEAAAQLGVNPASIYAMLARRGLEIPAHWPAPGRRVGSSNRPLKEMLKAAAESKDHLELALKLGSTTRQSGWDLAKRHGLKLGGKKKKP